MSSADKYSVDAPTKGRNFAGIGGAAIMFGIVVTSICVYMILLYISKKVNYGPTKVTLGFNDLFKESLDIHLILEDLLKEDTVSEHLGYFSEAVLTDTKNIVNNINTNIKPIVDDEDFINSKKYGDKIKQELVQLVNLVRQGECTAIVAEPIIDNLYKLLGKVNELVEGKQWSIDPIELDALEEKAGALVDILIALKVKFDAIPVNEGTTRTLDTVINKCTIIHNELSTIKTTLKLSDTATITEIIAKLNLLISADTQLSKIQDMYNGAFKPDNLKDTSVKIQTYIDNLCTIHTTVLDNIKKLDTTLTNIPYNELAGKVGELLNSCGYTSLMEKINTLNNIEDAVFKNENGVAIIGEELIDIAKTLINNLKTQLGNVSTCCSTIASIRSIKEAGYDSTTLPTDEGLISAISTTNTTAKTLTALVEKIIQYKGYLSKDSNNEDTTADTLYSTFINVIDTLNAANDRLTNLNIDGIKTIDTSFGVVDTELYNAIKTKIDSLNSSFTTLNSIKAIQWLTDVTDDNIVQKITDYVANKIKEEKDLCISEKNIIETAATNYKNILDAIYSTQSLEVSRNGGGATEYTTDAIIGDIQDMKQKHITAIDTLTGYLNDIRMNSGLNPTTTHDTTVADVKDVVNGYIQDITDIVTLYADNTSNLVTMQTDLNTWKSTLINGEEIFNTFTNIKSLTSDAISRLSTISDQYNTLYDIIASTLPPDTVLEHNIVKSQLDTLVAANDNLESVMSTMQTMCEYVGDADCSALTYDYINTMNITLSGFISNYNTAYGTTYTTFADVLTHSETTALNVSTFVDKYNTKYDSFNETPFTKESSSLDNIYNHISTYLGGYTKTDYDKYSASCKDALTGVETQLTTCNTNLTSCKDNLGSYNRLTLGNNNMSCGDAYTDLKTRLVQKLGLSTTFVYTNDQLITTLETKLKELTDLKTLIGTYGLISDVHITSVNFLVKQEHIGDHIVTDSTMPISITLPSTTEDNSIPDGSEVEFFRKGTGAMNIITNGANIQLVGGSTTKSISMNDGHAKKINSNTWLVWGTVSTP